MTRLHCRAIPTQTGLRSTLGRGSITLSNQYKPDRSRTDLTSVFHGYGIFSSNLTPSTPFGAIQRFGKLLQRSVQMYWCSATGPITEPDDAKYVLEHTNRVSVFFGVRLDVAVSARGGDSGSDGGVASMRDKWDRMRL